MVNVVIHIEIHTVLIRKDNQPFARGLKQPYLATCNAGLLMAGTM